MVTVAAIEEELTFAKHAAAKFEENPEWATFTTGEIVPGCLFAVRWGLGNDCVLVLRISEDAVPTVYQQIIRKKEAP